MIVRRRGLVWCLVVLFAAQLMGAEAKERPSRSLQSAKYAVRVSAQVEAKPPRIDLHWPKDACLAYVVYRRSFGSRHWDTTPVAVLKGDATTFVDDKVKLGIQYEYRVDKFAPGFVGRSYICSGIDLPLVEDRGGVLLLVESSVSPALTNELRQLKLDLVGDGWHVIRRETHRDDSVEQVRALIREAYQQSQPQLKALFLLGHIPVPYSGSISPDGHKNHLGAWPADLVYADVDGKWPDEKTHQTFARENQENIPGDGKYDRNTVEPHSLKLEVGRVDLANMPAFEASETELLRRYLQKNHDFRQGSVPANPKGLIDDNFGAFSGESFGWSGWSSFATFFGSGNTVDEDWFSTLPHSAYLWAYGCGGGSNKKANGVGNTGDFADKGSKAVFTMLFGSYFGDWNHPDNFLRAPLAAEGNGLTCAWDGRPHWLFHSMAMGKNIGYCALRTQSNDLNADYLSPDNTRLALSGKNDDSEWEPNPVHVALMGDPTLRMHPVPPPVGLASTKKDEGLWLEWQAPCGIDETKSAGVSYLVYRASALDQPFQRLTKSPIKETRFLDSSEPGSKKVYLVKTHVRQLSASGTYFNTSQGAFLNLAESFGAGR